MCYAITTPLLMLWFFINFDENPDKHKKEQVKTMYTRRISKQSKRSTNNMKKKTVQESTRTQIRKLHKSSEHRIRKYKTIRKQFKKIQRNLEDRIGNYKEYSTCYTLNIKKVQLHKRLI